MDIVRVEFWRAFAAVLTVLIGMLPAGASGEPMESLEVLPAPAWIHPSTEDMNATFYTFDATDDDYFLDWTDISGAEAYEVVADVTREFGGNPEVRWTVVATATPGIPASNSRMIQVSTGDDVYNVRVRAVGPGVTPVPGELSDSRIFTLSLSLNPTMTPTPTIGPTPDIDFNADDLVNDLDVMEFQSAWWTVEGVDSNFLPEPAVLADPIDQVDSADLYAFEVEYTRQRAPIPAPVLLSPASGAVFSPTDFDEGNVTFRWASAPVTYGRVRYQFRLRGPLTVDPPPNFPIIYTDEPELTTRFSLGTDPGVPQTPYEWWVVVFSPYGINEPTESARRIFYLE
jgi:hypothetical protein